MRRFVKECGCVDCGLPCMGNACRNKYKTYWEFICDECGDDCTDTLYFYGEKELCEDCYVEKMLEEAEKIELKYMPEEPDEL